MPLDEGTVWKKINPCRKQLNFAFCHSALKDLERSFFSYTAINLIEIHWLPWTSSEFMLVNTGSELSPWYLFFYLGLWQTISTATLWSIEQTLSALHIPIPKEPSTGEQTYVRLLSLKLSSVIPCISLHSIVISSSEVLYPDVFKCEPFPSSHGKMLNHTVLQQQCHFTKSRCLFHPPVKDVLRKECLKDRAISSSNIGEIYYIKKTVCSEYQNVEGLGYISNSYCYDIVFTFKQNSIIQHYFN